MPWHHHVISGWFHHWVMSWVMRSSLSDVMRVDVGYIHFYKTDHFIRECIEEAKFCRSPDLPDRWWSEVLFTHNLDKSAHRSVHSDVPHALSAAIWTLLLLYWWQLAYRCTALWGRFTSSFIRGIIVFSIFLSSSCKWHVLSSFPGGFNPHGWHFDCRLPSQVRAVITWCIWTNHVAWNLQQPMRARSGWNSILCNFTIGCWYKRPYLDLTAFSATLRAFRWYIACH